MGTRTSFRLLGTLVLLLACGALYFLLVRARSPVGHPSSSEAGGHTPADGTSPSLLTADADRPALQGVGQSPPRPHADAPPSASDGAPETVGEAGAGEQTLRVRLEVPTGFTAWPVSLYVGGRLERSGSRTFGVEYAARATDVRVPIERVLVREGVVYLVVELRHRDALTATEVVPVEAREHGVTMRLVPAHIVTARLLQPSGEPINADASLYRAGPDAPLFDETKRWRPYSVARDQADVEGRIRLRVAEPGKYLVVVERTGFEPWGRIVEVPGSGTVDLGDVVLGRGARLSGVVKVAGREVRHALIQAVARGEATLFYAWYQMLRWDGQRVSSYQEHVETDGEGRFEFTALSPGAYELSLTAVSPAEDVQPSRRVAGTQRTVIAPDDSVQVDLGGFLLDVEVRSGGTPTPGAVRLGSGPNFSLDNASADTDPLGRITFLLVPGLEYRVIASSIGYGDGVSNVRTGIAGDRSEVVVSLGGPQPRGTLHVRLLDEAGAPIELASMLLLRGGSRMEQDASVPRHGVHAWYGIEPGAWELTVFPGATSADDRDPHYFPAHTRAEITAGEPTEIRLTARRGGRLLLGVRDASGRNVAATVHVRDARGRAAVMWFEMDGPAVGENALDGTGPALGIEVLEPGTYEVRVEVKGKEALTKSATIEAGRTTRLDVVVP